MGGQVAPVQGMEAGNEFVKVEGFDEVVVSPLVESGHTVLRLVAGRQDQHRWQRPLAAGSAQHIQAVDVGQTQVEHHHAVRRVGQCGQCLTAGLYPVHRHARGAQPCHHPFADGHIVFNQQHFHAAIVAAWGVGWPRVTPEMQTGDGGKPTVACLENACQMIRRFLLSWRACRTWRAWLA